MGPSDLRCGFRNYLEATFGDHNIDPGGQAINVQCRFRQCYGRKPPDRKSIKEWHAKLKETGSVCDRPRIGGPTVTESKVDLVRRAHQRLDILRDTVPESKVYLIRRAYKLIDILVSYCA
ncbi:hypothetical protein AVEN_52044-1 [Araneus ventricosus]|uniref:Uncharacterized protein n=1 Tax=Araneus ventricosus TaxID=182803 RepID=A0A4Y2CEZ9_ARAVE|nr:hypothetical protein AVEN_52044-1 [Araneus ventricosus]